MSVTRAQLEGAHCCNYEVAGMSHTTIQKKKNAFLYLKLPYTLGAAIGYSSGKNNSNLNTPPIAWQKQKVNIGAEVKNNNMKANQIQLTHQKKTAWNSKLKLINR